MGALVQALRALERKALKLLKDARDDRAKIKQLEERLGRQGQ